jgi:hypothetical protein
MKTTAFLYKTGLFGALAFSVACAGPFFNQTAAVQEIGDRPTVARTLAVGSLYASAQPDHQSSWMRPQAKHQRLLYISDVGTDDVNVYAFDTGALVGQLTGFNEPQGMCSDSKGHVYVTNTMASDVLVYAHAGTTPIETLNDSDEYPVDCAVNPNSQLSVANIMTTSGGTGSVSIFVGTTYYGSISSTDFSHVDSIAFQPPRGDNFVTGSSPSNRVRFGSFSYADLKLHPVKPPTKSAGFVRFSGIHKYMAVGDQSGTIYLVHGPTEFSKIQLDGLCSVGQFSISRSYIAVPDPCGVKVLVYPFPRGNKPARKITAALVDPVGSAISINDLRGP